MQDNRDDLYLNLRDAGVGEDVIGTQQDFKNFVTNEKNTRDLYKNLRDAGVGEDVIGTEDDFYNFVAPDFSGNQSSGTTKAGSAAQQVVNEYDQSAKDNAKASEDLSAATAGAKIGGNISLTPVKANNQQTAQPAVDNTAKSASDASGTPAAQTKATGPKTQFVPSDPNYVQATPTAEALKKYPWMQPDQVYLWNKTTKEPVVSYFDENGQAVTDEDLQIKKAKSEITGQEDTEYMHPEAAALQLPNGNTRGVRLKKGAITGIFEKELQKYGSDYRDKKFTLNKGGKVYTGAELIAINSQKLYDELNSDVRKARISFAVSDEKDRNEILSRIKAKWGKVADENSLVNAVNDENAAKQDIDIVAQQNINDLNAEIQNISQQMDQRGTELDKSSWRFPDQTIDVRDVDPKYRLLQSKLNYAQNALKSWENVKNSGSLDALAGFKDAVMDISAWDFGFSDLKNAVSLLTAKGKDKQELVNLYGRSAEAAKFEDKYNPDSYRYGKIAGASIPFALQFVGTGGGFKSIGSAVSKKATSIAEKYALEGLKKQVVKGLGVAVGDIARAYTMSGTVQGLNTISDILTRSAGELTVDKQGNYQLKSDEPLLKSIYKGVTASAIENYTEMLGERLNIGGNLMRMLPKIGLRRVSNAITKIGTQDWYKVCNNWLSRAGVNDFGGEVLEEEIGIVLNAALVGDNPLLNGNGGLLDLRTQKDILGGMLYSISAMRAGALAMYGVKKGVGSAFVKTLDMYDKMQLNQSDKGGQSIFGEGWTEIKDEIDNTPNDKVNAVIEKLAKEHPSKDEQSAIIDYAVKLLKTRGHNLGIAMASDGEEDEGAQEEVKDMPDLSQPNAEYLNKDDGMIHKASLYPDASDPTGTAKDVFIIKGNLVTNEDGSINKDASDKTIIYIDGNGERHIASPDKFAAAYPPISNNEVQQANEGGGNEEAQTTTFNKGDEVNINVDGNNYTATIQGTDGFGNYNVYYEDESGMMHPAKFTADQLNEMNGKSATNNGQQATSEQPADVQQQVEQPVVEQPAQQEQETQQAQEEQKPAIPTDEKGNMLYHQVPIEATINDLYDGKLDDNEIRDFVDANIKEADKNLEKVNKKAPKIGTNKAEYLKKKQQWQNEVDEFTSIRDYWNSVKDYIAKQTHTTPEEVKAAQEELSGEAAKREYQGMAENVQQDPISVASDFIRGAKITPESFKAETGYGTGEQRKFVGMIAKAENGGKSIDRLAEELVSYDNAEFNGSLFGGDTSSAKDAILSALQGAGTRKDLKQTNEAEEQAYVDARNAARDAQYMEQYGMTYEEYLAYEEQIMPTIWREYNNYDETAFNNMYAEEIAQLLKSRENDTTGEKSTDDRGNKVLPEQQVNQQPGSEGSTEQGTEIQAGLQSNNENAVAPEETQQDLGVTERRIEEKPYATVESKGGYVNLHRERYDKDGITYTHAVAIRNGKAVNMPTALFPIPKYMEILDVPEGVSVLGINELREDNKGNSAATVVVRYEDGGTGKMDVRLQPVVAQKIATAEAETDTNPTEGQKVAGNYKKGHVRIDGYDVTIEQPKGSVRRGTDANGKQWEQKMNNTYGYIRGTEGVDGDHIDIFLSDNPTEGNVYVVDQVNPDGSFDEHKVMYGFNSADEARAAYLSNYEEGWKGLGTITEVSKDEFKKWVNSSKRKTKPFSEYKSVNAIGAQNEGTTVSDNTETIGKKEDEEGRKLLDKFLGYYDTVKEKDPSIIVIMRIGENDVVIRKDAEKVGKILGLTPNKSNDIKGLENEKTIIFPHSELDNFLYKMIRAGQRVALAEGEDNKKLENSPEFERNRLRSESSWIAYINARLRKQEPGILGWAKKELEKSKETLKVYKENKKKKSEGLLKVEAEEQGKVDAFEAAIKQIEEREKQIRRSAGELETESQDDVRFREDDKSLIAVHNLDESSLSKALDLGGFPMPSIAVTNKEIGHNEYGDISLLFDKSSIDPSDRRNKVYGGDAWTPVFPEINLKINESVADKLRNKINDLLNGKEYVKDLGLHIDNSNLTDQINRSKSFREAYKNNDAMKIAFLTDKGISFKPGMQDATYSGKVDNATLKKIVQEVNKGKASDLVGLGYDETMAVEPIVRKIVSEYNINKVMDAIPEEKRKDSKVLNFLLRNANKPLSFADMNNLFYDAYKYEQQGDKKVVDSIKTREKLNKKFTKKLRGEYENWLDEISEGIVEKQGIRNERDLFTPSGNRRSWEQLYDEITLNNVVRAMQSQADKGGGFFGGNIFGVAQKDITSIDELRKLAKQRLADIDSEEYDKIKENISSRLSNISIPGADRGFGSRMDMLSNISDAVASSKNASGIYKYLKKYYPKVSKETANEIADIVKDIQNMVTRYFEAKPYRAVRFDEVKAAVVPRGADKELVSRLESLGIDVRTYKKGDAESRKRAINLAAKKADILFRRQDTLDQYPINARNQIETEISSAVEELSSSLNTPIRVVRNLDDVKNSSARRAIEAGRNIKAWFDPNTKEVVVYMPNATDANDVKRSILHEVVGHKGLRELIGEERYDAEMERLFNLLPDTEKGKVQDASDRKYKSSIAIAMDEYLAEQAELDKRLSWWGKIVSAVRDLLRRVGIGVKLTDADVNYLLWKSKKKLSGKDAASMLEDVVRDESNELLSSVSYREITDKEKIKELDDQPKIKVYRAMQLQDGKLLPPMSGKVKTTVKDKNGKGRTKWVWREPTNIGKWEEAEERPDLANNDGTFTLNKGNNSLNAAYNPYIHTSRSPINDQFSSAWDRDELVTVEVEIPESELTSGYHAEKAKDSVGEVEWKSGPVGRQLAKIGKPRLVILSRYDKPVRILSQNEVADEYAKRLEGTNIEVPFNTVSPSLRDALVAKGVKIGAPENNNAGKASLPAYNEWVKTREAVNNEANDLYREADTEEEINSIIDKAKAGGTYMKAPNGKSTNLNERQWAQVRTKAFKDWFGDWENDPKNASKVVDENGEPKVVYHGSRSKSRINVFKEVYEKGTFFSTSKNVGSIYSSNNPDNLYSAFINAKNPLIVDNKGKDWNKIDAEDLIEAAEKMFNITKEEFLESLGEDRYMTTDGIVAAISRLSEENKSPYDGLILKNVIETNNNEIATDVVAIKSNQIKSATDNIGAFSPEDDDIRYRFIGEIGARNLDAVEEATTRLDNLSVAREMENAGKDAKSIKMATGWERGADGKWRYETKDFEYRPNGDARKNDKYKESDWYKELYGLEEKLFNGETLTDDELKRFDELSARVNSIRDNDKNTERIYLDDYVKDDELFKAYPELKQTKIDFVDLPNEGYSAKYNEKENRITVNQAKSIDDKSAIAHEVQHAIQHIEGFAQGGNGTEIQQAIDQVESKISDILKSDEYKKAINDFGKEYDQKIDKEVENTYPNLDPERKQAIRMAMRDDALIEYKKKSPILQRLSNLESELNVLRYDPSYKSPYVYNNLSGEVEARNVEARINMTPEQRRQSLASETEDVAREDQLFIYDNLGVSARQGTGALTDSELSNANDPVGKMLGEPSRTPAQQRAFAERERQRMADRAREVADILHLDNVEIVTDTSTLKGRRAKAKGFYSRDNGKIVIVVPNHVDMADIEQTVLHEAVAHYGLRKLFGKNFDTFLYNVYNNADMDVRDKIVKLAEGHNWDFATATEEYLASLAEKTNFENLNASWWDKIKSMFIKFLHNIGLKGYTGISLSDNELRYILWRSYENLKNPGRYRSIIDEARDMSMQNDLKVGNYSVQNSRNNVAEGSDNVLYREAKEVEEEINNDWRDEYDKKLSTFSFKLTEAAQDAMRSVKILQDIIAKETSAPISDDENVYWRENRLSSVNKYEQEYYAENYFKPIVTEIANLVKYGARYNDKGKDIINSDNDILKYLIAKHGIERNNYFREREAMNARKPYEDQIKELQKQVEKGEIKEEDANKKIAKLQEQADKAEMKKRVDVLHKDYSGLTELFQDKKDFDTLAASYVSDFEKKFDTEPLWNAINRATKGTLRKAFVDGLISKESYENTAKMYKYYIPLRGWANDVASEKYNYIGGKGHSSKILEISHGRTSLADNPISKIGQMMQDAILQGNRNRMKQAVYNLAMNHDTSLLNIKRQWYQNMGTKDNPIWERVFPDLNSDMTAEQVAEEVEDFESRMRELKKEGKATQNRKGLILRLHTTKREEAQHRISVAINGKEYNIFVNGNPRAAQAINGELNDVDRYGSYISKINRFLSQVYTSINPEFVVTNYQRDAGFAASIVASTEPLSYQKEWAKNMTIYNPITTGVYLNSLIKKAKTGNINPNNKAERYMQEFLSYGGETGFTNMLSADDYKKQIKRDIKSINSVVSLPKAARAAVAFTERANTVFEDATRYATYVTSREQGRTIDRSIRDAKEISLNFNTRGADGLPGDGFIYRFFRGLRRWQIFVNPSIQGLNKAGTAFRNHPLRSSMMIAGLPTLLGYALPAIMQAVVGGGDGDDDDKNVVESYKDLPKWVRRTNIAIPIGGNNFITIPLSYELRVSYGLGEMMWEYGEGMIDKEEIASETLSQLSDLLPISFANGTIAQNVAPTFARPLVDIIQNRNFYGKKIYNDSQFIEGYPEYMKAYAGTPKWLVKSTEVLNNVMPKFGADVSDKYTPGLIDLNPAMIDYILSSYLGGLYNFPSKVYKTISMIWDEDMRDIQNVPILSRNWKNSQSGNPYNSGDRYKTYMKEYDLSKQRFNGYKKEAKNDVPEFLNSLKDLLNTPSGKRMMMIDAYKRGGLDKLNQRIRDIDAYDNERYEGEKDALTKKRDEVKEELINKLDSISDGTLDFVNGEWVRK